MRKITLLMFLSFLSLCGYAQLPTQGFETWPPTGWGIYDNGSGTIDSWEQSELDNIFQPPYEGDHAAFVDNENVPDTNPVPQDWLVTPQFVLPADAQLRFFSRLAINGDDGGLYRIMISTGADQSALASYTEVIEWTELTINPTQQAYNEIIVDLPGTAGQNVYVAFVMEGDDADRWLVDNVTVVQQCVAPTNLSADNETLDSAELSWDIPTGVTSWEIEVLPNADPPTGIGEAYSGALPYVADDLDEGTDYKFYVRSVCSADNKSLWAGPFAFSTVSLGDTCAAPIIATALPYTTTDNTSNYGNDYTGSPGADCGSGSTYLSGDDVVYSYTPAADEVITISLTNLTDTYAGMFVYTSCADIGVSCFAGVVNGNSEEDMEIPELSVTGGTTYYIVISTWPAPDSVGYTLNIQKENCAAPTDLTATGATTTSIDLAWTEAGTAVSWQYVVQPAGTGVPTGSGVTTGDTSFTEDELNPSTPYEVYVRSDCGDGTFSSWTGPVTFGTLCEALDLPFAEGFNTDSTTELCWTVLDVNADDATWDMNYAFNPFEGDQSAAINTDFNGGANDDWLISPTINLTGNQRLKFHYRVQSSFEPNDFEVLLSTTGVDPANFDVTLIPLASYDNTEYVEVIVNLVDGTNTPVTGPMNIAWHVPGGGLDGWRLYIDNVIIEDIPSCPDPTNLTVTNYTTSSVDLGWTPGFEETEWEVVVQAPGTGEPTGSGVLVDENPYTNGGLDPSTQYEFYVRAVCAADDMSNWVGPITFTTPQIPAAMDFSDDFEAATTNWILNNATQANIWVLGSAVSNGGTQSLYITNDGGVTNGYNNGASSTVHAYRDIQMPDALDEISLSFDWHALAESCCDYLRVWVVPVSYTPVAGTQIDAGTSGGVQITPNLNGNADFTTENYVIDAAAYSNQIVRLVFEWRNDGSLGPNPPAAIDNINLAVITCPSPSDLAASGITLTGATIDWQGPTNATPDSYDYYLSTEDTAPTADAVPTGNVDDITVDLTDLESSTQYYIWIRSNCGTEDGTSFWVGPLAFNTLCDSFDVPFYEGFNTSSSSEFCWTVLDSNGDDQTWDTDYATNPYEGDQSANINTDFNAGANDDWLISPTINLTGNQRLKFHFRVQSSFEPNDFEVLLSTSGLDPASFTTTVIPLASYDNTEYVEVIVNLVDGTSTPISGPVNIAWHIPAAGLDGWRLYIDNVIIEDIPPCTEPINVEVSCLSSTGANFSWEQGGTETSWEVAITESGAPAPTSGIEVTEPLYYAMDLEIETDYTFYVRSVCPDGAGFGSWVLTGFTTPQTSVLDANGFCASDGPDSSILFDNVHDAQNIPGYGQVACLGSTPNPVWYYLQVEDTGQLDFQLVQNTEFDENGNPTGQGLDVDFVAYGPFTSLNEACGQIELVDCPSCPNNTTNPDFYPFGNIVDCSYSAAPVENFTIPDAVEGEIYAVLITNFNGDPGQIKLQQLESSEGSTNCDILYEVTLGEDQFLCGEDEALITATVTTPGDSEAPTYEWFIDGVAFTPTVVDTQELSQTISVNEPGSHVYSVIVSVENALNTEPITDEVTIVFGPGVTAVQPQDYILCDDVTNDGVEVFDLTTLEAEAIGDSNPEEVEATFYETQEDAELGINEIANPQSYASATQTIFIRVSGTAVFECFDVVPANLVVNPTPITTLDPQYVICEGESVTITGVPVNYAEADATYLWYREGVLIDGETSISITANTSGIYTLEVNLNNCTNTVDTEVIVNPTPVFTISGADVVCDPSFSTMQVNAENFDPATATYSWTLNNAPVAGNGPTLQATGFGTYEVTVTVGNCSDTGTFTVTENPDAVALAFEDGCEGANYFIHVSAVDGSFDPETSTISWTGPNGFTSSEMDVMIEDEGVYTVTVTTFEGCIGEGSVDVGSSKCLVPKGVSPNNDGLNDRFDLDGFNVTRLSIFNRYGQEVYSRADYTDEWFGQTDSGDELPSGTYFYSMERANGESKTGWVYVNRQEN